MKITIHGAIHMRQTIAHSESCCIKEWVCPEGVWVKGRDRTGRMNHMASSSHFLRFRCNDHDCPAQMLLSMHDLYDLVNGGRA